MSPTVDVLIIGGGPAGLICAYNLSQAGFRVRIVDKKLERLQKGQGDVLQIRGMEILDSLGLSSKLLSDAHRYVHVATYASSPTNPGEITRVSRRSVVQDLESSLPTQILYAQSSIEGIFREAMASGQRRIPSATFQPPSDAYFSPSKVDVEQGVYPTKMEVSENPTDEYPVTVELEHSNGQTETIRAKYLLGCDGAHSWTRAQIGLEMVGETSDQVWGIMDGFIASDFPDIRALTIVENNGRRGVLVPRENDMVRFTVQVADSDVCVDPATGRVDRTKIQAERIKQLVQELYRPYHIEFTKELDWWGVYVIGQRLASGYQDKTGRVFILGDACHTHSPHAGQGMNAAISDAHNLSWKLVHVLRGWAGSELLRTYETERRGFAIALIDLHARIAEVMSGKVKGTSADILTKSLSFVSGIGTHYPPSKIVDTTNQLQAPGIVLGERMPHQVILRAADLRPYSTLDLLKSDNLYKIVIFTGNAKDEEQRKRLEKLGIDLPQKLGRTLNRIQLFTIMLAKKESADYTDVPALLRPHWDTVFIDDVAYTPQDGGGRAYQSLQVGPEGCLVLVRPDGHVAALAPLDGVEALSKFFSVTKN